ncbi:MAG: hypothetical protein NC299_11885 [Lachnospiraceae bacterium]|nr:hypothetical protein [Lachnospiraceae bacterium]
MFESEVHTMPKGYPKNPRPLTIAEAAVKSAPLQRDSTSTDSGSAADISPASVPAPTPRPDLLTAVDISAPSLPAAAEAEQIAGTTAYAAKRLGDLSRQEIHAKTLRVKQIARQRGYRLDALIHDPAQLQAALDDFDVTCFDLGLFPLQHLLSVWLTTTAAQLQALTSVAHVSEAGQILAAHADYCVSVVSAVAIQSDKPPVFSIYYLKTAYSLFDEKNSGQNYASLSVFSGSVTQHIHVDAADISKKTALFAEIEAAADDKGGSPED